MASDQERREVAEKLRKLKGFVETLPSEYSIECKAAMIIEKVLDCMDYNAAESWDFFELLADLIEPPTCHFSYTDNNLATVVRCSRCGKKFLEPLSFNYCPSCGAEIIVS